MPSPVVQVRAVDVPADATVLDVREDEEWVAGHVRDALHIPMGQVVARLAEVPDARPLYVICRSGVRSDRVAQFLCAHERQAVNVDGGMLSWVRAGRPMTRDGDGPARVA